MSLLFCRFKRPAWNFAVVSTITIMIVGISGNWSWLVLKCPKVGNVAAAFIINWAIAFRDPLQSANGASLAKPGSGLASLKNNVAPSSNGSMDRSPEGGSFIRHLQFPIGTPRLDISLIQLKSEQTESIKKTCVLCFDNRRNLSKSLKNSCARPHSREISTQNFMIARIAYRFLELPSAKLTFINFGKGK